MDGVLIDSEPLWQRAEIEIFGGLGLHLTPELCRTTMGLRIDEVVDHWFRLRPWSGPEPAEVVALVVDRMRELIGAEGSLLPGVREAIAFLRERVRGLGLASSSFNVLIDAVLDGFGIRDAFDVVVSAEDEPHGKPHPGIYLTAARLLSVDPDRCVAIEDSPNGVRSAKAAGMRCIALPAPGEVDPEDVAEADVVLRSLTELDEEVWASLDA